MAEKKFKILMIEDDIFFRKLYRDQSTKAGFEFSEATTGVEGMHKIMTDKPDLILLDLMLPGRNGFDILKEIKNDPKTRNIPIIVLTNLSQESDKKEAINLGVKDYLVKSENRMSEVIELIKNKYVQ